MGCFEFLPRRDSERRKKQSCEESSHPVSSEEFRDSGTGTTSGSQYSISDPSVNFDVVVDAAVAPDTSGVDSPSSKRSQSTKLFQSGSLRKPNDLRDFSFQELRRATKNFSRQYLLGEGGFGQVFKGTVIQKQKFGGGDEKVEVAVKQLNSRGQQGHKEWLAEVHFLGLVDCPYLVKLIGYCANDDDERGIQRLLVYEFMPNKGLDDHLFRKGPRCLSWSSRVKIILGAARGLAYLHEEMEIQVIFRDFKTSNVLLDEDFNPKLSDFGLARQGPQEGDSHVSTAIVGTAGYAAPEYIQTGHLTVKSDVWSFGIVMLEVLTGRRVMDRNRPKNEQRLVDWARPYISDVHKFFQVVDPNLDGKYPVKAAQKFAQLAYQCLCKPPKHRPKMSDVVDKLKLVLEKTYQWESPSLQPPSPGIRVSVEVPILCSSGELSRPSKQSPKDLTPGSLPSVESGKVLSESPKSRKALDEGQMLDLCLESSILSPRTVDTSGETLSATSDANSTAPSEANSSVTSEACRKKLLGSDRLARMSRESGRWIQKLSFSTSTGG